MQPLKVLVLPRDWNPYQELLYQPMRNDASADITVSYCLRYSFVWPILVPLVLISRRLLGYRVLHIHWQSLHIAARVPGARLLSYWNYRAVYRFAVLLGFTLVWTVHNVLPHESQTIDDVDIAVRLSKMSAAKIVHSTHSLEQMAAKGLDTSHTTVIPHGNYVGSYPESSSRDEARKTLGLAPNDVAMLFFGNIRPYKGVDDLLAAWPHVANTEVTGGAAKLIIAGNCLDDELRARLIAAPVTFVDGRVDDNEVAAFFMASDIVCAPFKAITTSGSVLLALSFGRPVVAPRLGALRDLPDDVGFFYSDEDPDGLVAALRAAISCPDPGRVQHAANSYAESISWDAVSRSTVAVYREALRVTEADNR